MDIDKLEICIKNQGCRISLCMAKDVAYELATAPNKYLIQSIYKIYNELNESELTFWKVIDAIEAYLSHLSHENVVKFFSLAYPTIKI
ncbi:hypothetical protein BCU43_006875 [Vibrio lentus]|nr:hypothetical protein [Vibrio lentus]